jgi:hypothetical protein
MPGLSARHQALSIILHYFYPTLSMPAASNADMAERGTSDMAATAVIYLLWGATIGIAASTTLRALLTEHPLSQTERRRSARR